MLKDDIIRELELNRNKPLSGQSLADKYSVSRNAVWKVINQLKEEGYEILSDKKGYVLAESSDVISAQGIRQYITSEKLDIKVFQSIDSTNNEAKRMISETPEHGNVLIVASEQTKGRGRLGRDFYSPEDKGIYMTLLYNVLEGVEKPMLITMAAAVAVVKTIEALTDLKPQIKWVNDIFVGGKKVGGILTEGTTDLETGRIETVAVGIGINIKPQDFPDSLKSIATSLDVVDINRNRFIAEITNNLMYYFGMMDDNCFMDEYIEHSFVVGKKVSYQHKGDKLLGTVKAINKDGSLTVITDNNEEINIIYGEIVLE